MKYRFVHESGWRPTVAIFPMVELPSGDAAAGLGNGATARGGARSTFATFGGYYTPQDNCLGCQVLFDLGHSIAGDMKTTAYLGLYWTWGPGGRE